MVYPERSYYGAGVSTSDAESLVALESGIEYGTDWAVRVAVLVIGVKGSTNGGTALITYCTV